MDQKIQCVNVISTGSTAGHMSRQELLNWINELLGIKLQKVEQLCSGAVYCQLLNIVFPGFVPLKKVKLNTNQEHEYQFNLKMLQNALIAVGCDKSIPIDKLIKGRFQDNFEFLQWFKRFFDANYGAFDLNQLPKPKPSSNVNKSATKLSATTKKNTPSQERKCDSSYSDNKINTLKLKLLELQNSATNLEKEKEFYLNKLRDIEIFCQESSSSESENLETKEMLVGRILEKLYETEEGFDVPTEETCNCEAACDCGKISLNDETY